MLAHVDMVTLNHFFRSFFRGFSSPGGMFFNNVARLAMLRAQLRSVG